MSRSKVSSVEMETRSTWVSSPRSSIPRARSRSSAPTLPGSSRSSAASSSSARAPIVVDARVAQPLLRPGPDPGEQTHVEGRQERGLAAGPHDGEAAGLSPVGRHLRHHLAGGDAERAGQRGRAADGRLHRFGQLAGCEEVACDLPQVEVALVDPGLLDGRDDLTHRAPDRPRVLAVQGMTGADEDRVRAAAQRLGAAHRRADAVPARDVVCGGDHAAALRVSADHQGLSAQGGILELLDGGEEGIEIEVRDDHRHQE